MTNTLYVLVGLPGSGKSTWAQKQNKDKELFNTYYINYPKVFEQYICEETLGQITTINNEDIVVEVDDISIKIKKQ